MIALSLPWPLPVKPRLPNSSIFTPVGLRELTIGLETLGEPLRRAHRPDGVRARRPDADLEDVEDRDVHALTQPSAVSSASEQDARLDARRQRGDRRRLTSCETS